MTGRRPIRVTSTRAGPSVPTTLSRPLTSRTSSRVTGAVQVSRCGLSTVHPAMASSPRRRAGQHADTGGDSNAIHRDTTRQVASWSPARTCPLRPPGPAPDRQAAPARDTATAGVTVGTGRSRARATAPAVGSRCTADSAARASNRRSASRAGCSAAAIVTEHHQVPRRDHPAPPSASRVSVAEEGGCRGGRRRWPRSGR